MPKIQVVGESKPLAKNSSGTWWIKTFGYKLISHLVNQNLWLWILFGPDLVTQPHQICKGLRSDKRAGEEEETWEAKEMRAKLWDLRAPIPITAKKILEPPSDFTTAGKASTAGILPQQTPLSINTPNTRNREIVNKKPPEIKPYKSTPERERERERESEAVWI